MSATSAPVTSRSGPDAMPDQSYCDLGMHQQCSGYTEGERDPETCMCPCHDLPFRAGFDTRLPAATS